MKYFKCECMKTKGKLLTILLPVLGFIALWGLWNVHGMEDTTRSRGYTYLTQFFFIMNSIFLPLTIAVMASRLMDMENKGGMYKLLCTLQKKSQIFMIKLMQSFLTLVLFFAAELVLAWVLGTVAGVEEAFPLASYFRLFGIGLLTGLLLSILQIFFSLKFENQLYALFIGLVGCFIGLFSMFFPTGSFFSYLCPWSYFTFGCPVSIGFDEAAGRLIFEPLPFDFTGFAVLLTATAAALIFVRAYFMRKDV